MTNQNSHSVIGHKDAPKLFKSDFANLMLATSSVIVLTILLFTVVFAQNYYYKTILNPSASIAFQISWFFIGLLSWTLGEYLLHRFLYHDPIDGSYMKKFHYTFHGIHHKYPNDKSKTVIPPVPGLLIASIIQSVFFCIFWLVTGSGDLSFVFCSGFLIGYLLYMMVHYVVHRYPMPQKGFKFWWMHHHIHHYQQHDKAFGVTTSLWDFIFGTMPIKGRRVTHLNVK